MLSGAGSTLGQRQQQLTDAAGEWMEATRDYVRQKPGTAVGIAVGRRLPAGQAAGWQQPRLLIDFSFGSNNARAGIMPAFVFLKAAFHDIRSLPGSHKFSLSN